MLTLTGPLLREDGKPRNAIHSFLQAHLSKAIIV